MDHLPYPCDSHVGKLRVPLLIPASEPVDYSCSTSNLNDFLQQWQSAESNDLILKAEALESAIARVQERLYFGLLSRFLGNPIEPSLLSSGNYIDTSTLPDLLRENKTRILQSQGLDIVLWMAEREVRRFIGVIDERDAALLDRAQVVVLSVRILSDILWCTLRNTPMYASEEFMRHHERYANVYSSPGVDCEILRRRMRIEDGWCRATVSHILSNFTSSTAYYISSIPRERDRLAPLHRKCTDLECKLEVQEDQYQQQHSAACRGADCKMVQPPLEKVLSIIEGGGIPLMKLVGGELEVHKAKYKLEYTAITHVWSGGLGNPEANAMWLCQLKELTALPRVAQKKLRASQPRAGPEMFFPMLWDIAMDPSRLWPKPSVDLFWIDTLCIPRTVNRTDQTHQDRVWARRQDSINRMTQTYAAACSVILLDPELRNYSYRPVDGSESSSDENQIAFFAKVSCSGWMTRCWTYHEGALANELLVQCKDGPVVLGTARAQVMRRNKSRLQNSSYTHIDDMMDEISVWFSRLPGTRADTEHTTRQVMAQSNPEVFTRIWNDLAMRSSSRPIDRLQIFSLLVDLAPADLLQMHNSDRLKAILKAQSNLPLALLFQRPLSRDQLLELRQQQQSEEQADRDRCTLRVPSPHDDYYPLPTRIRSEPLPHQLGWMKRDETGHKYIYFNQSLLQAGTMKPSLFQLENATFTTSLRYYAYENNTHDFFRFSFGSPSDRDLVSPHDKLHLLVSFGLMQDSLSNSPRIFPGVLLRLRKVEQNAWRFQRVCSVVCKALGTSDRRPPALSFLVTRLQWDSNIQYEIDCDFSTVGNLRHHRIDGFRDPRFTTFKMLSTMTPLFVLYYLVFFGLIAPAAFTHGPVSFPSGFFALIGFLFCMRILAYAWNGLLDWTRSARDIIFNEWVNGLYNQDGVPPTIDRSRHHTGFYIHMTPVYTLAFGGVCMLFIILGGVYFQQPKARWLIPVGVAGIVELVLKFLAEYFYSSSTSVQASFSPSRSGTDPEYPGYYDNFFQESRLMRWLRRTH